MSNRGSLVVVQQTAHRRSTDVAQDITCGASAAARAASAWAPPHLEIRRLGTQEKGREGALSRHLGPRQSCDVWAWEDYWEVARDRKHVCC